MDKNILLSNIFIIASFFKATNITAISITIKAIIYLILKLLNRLIKNNKNRAQKKTIMILNIFPEFFREHIIFKNTKNNPVMIQNRTNPEGALYNKKKNIKNRIKNGVTLVITIFLLYIMNGINMETAEKQNIKTGKILKAIVPNLSNWSGWFKSFIFKKEELIRCVVFLK